MDLTCRTERKVDPLVSKLSQKANAFSIDSLLAEKDPKEMDVKVCEGLISTSDQSGASNPKHADLPPGNSFNYHFCNLFP